jgi:PEP-CTERM motif
MNLNGKQDESPPSVLLILPQCSKHSATSQEAFTSRANKQQKDMKRTVRLACATLAIALAAHIASAQFITNTVQNTQSMGLRYDFGTGIASQQGGTSPWKPSARNQATPVAAPTSGIANKIWLDFDLSSAWATYGKGNLVSATLTLWGENGPTRRFDVVGLNDGTAGETTWTSAGLSWANAPGNDVTSGHLFSSSTFLYQRLLTGVAGVGDAGVSTISADPATAANTLYDQCARYTSADISSFLLADSNDRVTIMISDGAFNDNQNWWTGVGGSYDVTNPIYFTAGGEVIRDSPTLTLVFTPIPEPATFSLVALGFAGLLIVRRRR